jgi:hypothetical protein
MASDRPQRPMLCGGCDRLRFVGPVCPLINPGTNQADLRRGEPCPFPLRRHQAEVRIDARHQSHESALGALAGDDFSAVVATFERPLLLVQPQASFVVLAAVA